MKLKLGEWLQIKANLEEMMSQDLDFSLMWDLSELYDELNIVAEKTANQLRNIAVQKFGADSTTFEIPKENREEWLKAQSEFLAMEKGVDVPELKREQFEGMKSKYISKAFKKIIS